MSLMYDALRGGSTDSASQPAKSHGSAGLPVPGLPAQFPHIRTKLVFGCIAGLLLGGAVTAALMRGLKTDEAKLPATNATLPEKISSVNPGSKDFAVNGASAVNTTGGKESVNRYQAPLAPAPGRLEPALKLTAALPVVQPATTPPSLQSSRAAVAMANDVPAPKAGKQAKASTKIAADILPKTAQLGSAAQTVPTQPAVPIQAAVPVQPAATQPATTQPAVTRSINSSAAAEASPQAGKVVNLAANTTPPADDAMSLPDRFDAMNKALGKSDKSDAMVHLKAIQSALPSNSIARMRAEGWHEFQTGNVETAKSTYRKILERLPADDHAKAVLQAMGAPGSQPIAPK